MNYRKRIQNDHNRRYDKEKSLMGRFIFFYADDKTHYEKDKGDIKHNVIYPCRTEHKGIAMITEDFEYRTIHIGKVYVTDRIKLFTVIVRKIK